MSTECDQGALTFPHNAPAGTTGTIVLDMSVVYLQFLSQENKNLQDERNYVIL